MYEKILGYAKKVPLQYELSSAPFWDDIHISKSMLDAHLDPDFDGASRKLAFMEAMWQEKRVWKVQRQCAPWLDSGRPENNEGSRGDICIVADDHGEIAGTAVFGMYGEGVQGKTAELRAIYLSSDNISFGIGHGLYSAAEQAMRGMGYIYGSGK